jgi:hypothetical protein
MKTRKTISQETTTTPTVYSLRMAGKPFAWPTTYEQSYYIVETKTEQVIFCMPGGMQVFYPKYSVPPGEGIHFLRISDQLVMQMPEQFDDKSMYKDTIRGLGLTVAEVPDIETPSTEAAWQQYKKRNAWAEKVEIIASSYDFRNYQGLSPELVDLLNLWVRSIDCTGPDHQEVAISLSRDLAKTPFWKDIEDSVGKVMKKSRVDFDALTLLGSERKTRPGSSFSLSANDEKSPAIVQKVLRKQRRLTSKNNEDVKWTIRRGASAPQKREMKIFLE